MSFYFLYNVVLENYSVQNSPWGEGGLLPAQGLIGYASLLLVDQYQMMALGESVPFWLLRNCAKRNR